jgi:hypothetical protein
MALEYFFSLNGDVFDVLIITHKNTLPGNCNVKFFLS